MGYNYFPDDVFIKSLKDLLNFWTTKINQNYLYLLNKEYDAFMMFWGGGRQIRFPTVS